MRIFHYTNPGAAKKIFRTLKKGFVEFYLGSQEQSGHDTGSYWSLKSPSDLAAQNKPVSRYFGTTAMTGNCVVFEFEVDDDWLVQKKVPDSLPAYLKPIPGERGSMGIALCMNKGKAYTEPLDPEDSSRIAQNDCILLAAEALKRMYIMDAGAKPVVIEQMGVAPNNVQKLAGFVGRA